MKGFMFAVVACVLLVLGCTETQPTIMPSGNGTPVANDKPIHPIAPSPNETIMPDTQNSTATLAPCHINCQKDDIGGVVLAYRNGKLVEAAGKVATGKGWRLLLANSLDPQAIAGQIKEEYSSQPFAYLLIISPNSEIPAYSGGLTDPALYGRTGGDGAINLAVGRLPFDSPEMVGKYFDRANADPKKAAAFSYSFSGFSDAYPKKYDEYDAFLVNAYDDDSCLLESAGIASSLYRMAPKSAVLREMASDGYVKINVHGGPDGFSTFSVKGKDSVSLDELGAALAGSGISTNLDADNVNSKDIQAITLSGRPVVSMESCSTAQEFGVSVMDSGASAFIGAYTPSGRSDAVDRYYFSGISLGRSVSWGMNEMMAYSSTTGTIGKTNTFDATHASMQGAPTLILYGDPSLKWAGAAADNSISVKNNSITITLEANPKIIQEAPTLYKMCYQSPLIMPSQSGSGGSHVFGIWLNTRNIKSLDSVSIYSGGAEIDKDLNTVAASLYRFSDQEQYLNVRLDNSRAADANKELTIVIAFTPAS